MANDEQVRMLSRPDTMPAKTSLLNRMSLLGIQSKDKSIEKKKYGPEEDSHQQRSPAIKFLSRMESKINIYGSSEVKISSQDFINYGTLPY